MRWKSGMAALFASAFLYFGFQGENSAAYYVPEPIDPGWGEAAEAVVRPITAERKSTRPVPTATLMRGRPLKKKPRPATKSTLLAVNQFTKRH
ncbi:MAG: hypothetical protein C6W57_10655 [Caldibacillus debilis]|nr:MAG: hypothetical protein C6W57_10655 [Caldibacillus debilis]